MDHCVSVGLFDGATLVGGVEVVYVEGVAARGGRLVPIINRVGSVAFLGVERAAIVANRGLRVKATVSKSVSVGIKAEISLIQKLLVETRSDWNILACGTRRNTSFLTFEEFCQDQFLLIIHSVNINTFALNRSVEGIVPSMSITT